MGIVKLNNAKIIDDQLKITLVAVDLVEQETTYKIDVSTGNLNTKQEIVFAPGEASKEVVVPFNFDGKTSLKIGEPNTEINIGQSSWKLRYDQQRDLLEMFVDNAADNETSEDLGVVIERTGNSILPRHDFEIDIQRSLDQGIILSNTTTPDDAAVTVTITDATLAMSDTANSSIAENVAYSAAAPTITGAPMGTVTYSLAGSDMNLFSVAADGSVSMAGQDFENPADTGADNVYHYTLIAQDEEVNTVYDQVYVTVTDDIEGDTTAPTVSSFSSTTSDGSYNAGDTINITATTSESVQSGNTITVTLDTGDTVLLTAASAGTTLTGTYTVGAGDTSSDLTVSSFSIGTVADTAGNAMTSTTVPSNNNIADSSDIVVDTSAPTLSSSSPADNATAVEVDSNIVLNFSEAVDVESGDIVIYKASDNSVVETIAVGSGQVTGTGTTQITINPSGDLASSTEYYVQIEATGFDDAAGNSYAGITDTTSLSFTTADIVAPSLSINDVSYTKSNSAGNATFTVILSEASGQDVTVDYASSDVSTTAGSDYTASSGTVTILAGNTTASINVPILVDTLDEASETATLTLSNASNASISDATGTLTIVDGDTTASAATLTISTSGFTGATTSSVPSGASGLNAIVDSYLNQNETINGTSSADYIEIQDSANSNVGSISGGNGDDIIYIKGWGSATNSSVTGDGGTDTLVINSSIYSSVSNWNNNNGIKSGTIHFTNGGSITINNFEAVKGIWGSAGKFERKISITATLNDTDGSESLSDITVSNLPDNTTVKDSDGNDVSVSSNAFTVDNVASGTAQVFTLTKTGPFDFTANGAVIVTESNGGATTTTNASALIDGVVEGVEYLTTSGMSGLTNQEGLFNYQDGDDITFKVGGVVLGVATAEDVISGRTFLQDIADVERSNLSDDYLENMAIFLQSLDANYNPADGITITQQMRINLADIELDLRQASSNEVKQAIEQVGGIYVERDEAMEHVKDMLIEYSDMKESDFELIDVHTLNNNLNFNLNIVSSKNKQQGSSLKNDDNLMFDLISELNNSEEIEQYLSALSENQDFEDFNVSASNNGKASNSENDSSVSLVSNPLNSILESTESSKIYDL